MNDDTEYEIKIKLDKNSLQNILKVDDLIAIIFELLHYLRDQIKHTEMTTEEEIVMDKITKKLWSIIESHSCGDLFY